MHTYYILYNIKFVCLFKTVDNLDIMKLSIIIPAYNEKNTILEILKRIGSVDLSLEKEIIIVDDHSTDGTVDILKKLDRNRYKIIFKEKNEGKGAAIKTGLEHARGEIIIFQDADLEYDPRDYPAMIRPILENRTEVVLGVRIKPERDERKRKLLYWLSLFGNKLITWTTNLLFWNNAGEYESCYKAFTRRLLDTISIKANGFEYDNELICKILKKGYKTFDVPVRYYPRDYDAGKKIKWQDGFKILLTIIKERF